MTNIKIHLVLVLSCCCIIHFVNIFTSANPMNININYNKLQGTYISFYTSSKIYCIMFKFIMYIS